MFTRAYPSINSILRLTLYSIPLLFLLGFFFYPLGRIMQLSLFPGGQLDLGNLGEFIRRPLLWQTLWFTTWQAAASTLLTVLIGMPLAYIFAHYHFPGKALLRALTTIPFVMPTVVVAAAFTALAGRNGLLDIGSGRK